MELKKVNAKCEKVSNKKVFKISPKNPLHSFRLRGSENF